MTDTPDYITVTEYVERFEPWPLSIFDNPIAALLEMQGMAERTAELLRVDPKMVPAPLDFQAAGVCELPSFPKCVWIATDFL